jgi:uridylate kinase
MGRRIIIKVGGSLLYDEGMQLNIGVLDMIKEWYKRKKKEYDLIVIVVGGGRLSREVGTIVKKHIRNVRDVHSVAMELTQTNAYILKGYFGDKEIFNPESLGDAYEFLMGGKGVMISGGLKHGWSTDMDAAIFADVIGERKVYKLSDIDGLYTQDPKNNPKAKLILDIKWEKYRKMFGIGNKNDEHTPNLHIPISAECSLFAENKKIAFWVSGGSTFKSKRKLDSVFESGTHIHN